MKKLILAIIVTLAAFFFMQEPVVKTSGVTYGTKDIVIAQHEKSLGIGERFSRLWNFPSAVQKAVDLRVEPANYVPAAKIPKIMKQAIVSIEDRRFYEHGGLDSYGIMRALYQNVVAGETLEGGSTITQQLVKNLFLSQERTFTRKAEEGILALLMEHYYSKDEILAMYLNCIYYGNDYYGLKEASKGYYKISPEYIDLAEAALLAGLVQAPSYYNPFKNPQEARNRRSTVLMVMRQQNIITPSEVEKAEREPLVER